MYIESQWPTCNEKEMVKITRVAQYLSSTTEKQGVLTVRMLVRHIPKYVQFLWLFCQFLKVIQSPMPAMVLTWHLL